MKKIPTLLLAITTLGLATALDANAFFVSAQLQLTDDERLPELSLSEGVTSGHEEITRQALVDTKKLIEKNLRIDIDSTHGGLVDGLGNHLHGPIGAGNKNEVIRGNYCTDMPKDRSAVFDLVSFWFPNSGAIDWHNDGRTQTVHFLRNHTPTGLVSAKQACIEARNRILTATQVAVTEWQAGRKENSSFLFGHATHMLQDSFAPAHTQRNDQANNFDLRDLCYYGSKTRDDLARQGEEDLACYHEPVDLAGDAIWIRTIGQLMNAKKAYPGESALICDIAIKALLPINSLKRSCLKAEARLARDATSRYLYTVTQDLTEHQIAGKPYDTNELKALNERLMREVFEGSVEIPGLPNKMPQGILRCELLYT